MWVAHTANLAHAGSKCMKEEDIVKKRKPHNLQFRIKLRCWTTAYIVSHRDIFNVSTYYQMREAAAAPS